MPLENNSTIIFTDGSSRGNPGPGGYGVVILTNMAGDALYREGGYVIELGGREDHTTNNRMELQAVISALSYLNRDFAKINKYAIYTDSSYVINGITKWIKGWMKNGWQTSTKNPVENRDLWEILWGETENKEIKWILLPGHSGIAGNERCDFIATAFADKKIPDLYKGSVTNHPLGKDLYDMSYKKDLTNNSIKRKNRAHSRAKAYSYVSNVDGITMVHKTWAQCEARVRGKSNARFKKTLSAAEEATLKSEWGSV